MMNEWNTNCIKLLFNKYIEMRYVNIQSMQIIYTYFTVKSKYNKDNNLLC